MKRFLKRLQVVDPACYGKRTHYCLLFFMANHDIFSITSVRYVANIPVLE